MNKAIITIHENPLGFSIALINHRYILLQLIGVFTGFDFLDDEIDDHDDDISGFGWDLPSGEYTTPEPGDSRLRHSPLFGSEPDIIAAYRVDTSDEDDEVGVVIYLSNLPEEKFDHGFYRESSGRLGLYLHAEGRAVLAVYVEGRAVLTC